MISGGWGLSAWPEPRGRLLRRETPERQPRGLHSVLWLRNFTLRNFTLNNFTIHDFSSSSDFRFPPSKIRNWGGLTQQKQCINVRTGCNPCVVSLISLINDYASYQSLKHIINIIWIKFSAYNIICMHLTITMLTPNLPSRLPDVDPARSAALYYALYYYTIILLCIILLYYALYYL